MPDEDNNFNGFSVLDSRKWWSHVQAKNSLMNWQLKSLTGLLQVRKRSAAKLLEGQEKVGILFGLEKNWHLEMTY